MTEPRFIQIHWLAGYPGSLLNRDDAGLAKRLPFGPAVRTRISSQCLKRHWRVADRESDHAFALQKVAELSEVDFGRRSRRIFERMAEDLVEEFIELEKVQPEMVGQTVAKLVQRIFEPEKELKPSEEGDEEPFSYLRFEQAILIGRPEYEYLKNLCRAVLQGDTDASAALEARRKKKTAALTPLQKEIQKNLSENLSKLRDATRVPQSVEAALFGRMVTSDLMANWDAAIHVAHAFTVHEEQPEQDYFTVVDDLKREGEDAGAAGIFDTELTSGLYYGYVVVDVPLLVSNLTGVKRGDWLAAETDRALAGRVLENLVHLIATVTPGAKKGSTAPYSRAELVLVEAGRTQPRTLANAFREPVSLDGDGVGLLGRASERMVRYLRGLDDMYGTGETRRAAALPEAGLTGIETSSVPDLAAWLRGVVTAGEA